MIHAVVSLSEFPQIYIVLDFYASLAVTFRLFKKTVFVFSQPPFKKTL
jgi:hypothetical protein